MADKWCVYCFIFKQESRDSPFLCPPSGWLLGHAPVPAPPLIKQEYTPNIMIFVIGRAKPELGTRHRSLHPCPNNKKKEAVKKEKSFLVWSLLAVFGLKAAPLRHAMRKWSSLSWRVNIVSFLSSPATYWPFSRYVTRPSRMLPVDHQLRTKVLVTLRRQRRRSIQT